jgi:hypothetical protein
VLQGAELERIAADRLQTHVVFDIRPVDTDEGRESRFSQYWFHLSPPANVIPWLRRTCELEFCEAADPQDS